LEDSGLGYIIHTNHYLSNKLEYLNKYGAEQRSIDSIQRLRRFDELLKKERGNITVDKLKEFLSDHANYPYTICRHGEMKTVASIISEPESHCMHVSAGNPCEGRYYTYEMEY